MTHKERADVFDRVMRDAIAHLTSSGWEHNKQDSAYIDSTYERWLEQTREEWARTGIRDREPLRDAVGEYFRKRYGEETGQALLILWSFLLELRARRNGHTTHTPQA